MCNPGPFPPATENVASPDEHARRVAALAAMPAALEVALNAIPPARWRDRPREGGFSLVEQACHLRDIDGDGYRRRLAAMLAHDLPSFPDLDGAKLARERDYQRQDAPAAAAAFSAGRAAIVRQLAGLGAAERARAGLMDGRTRITVDGLVAAMLEHDAGHRAELEALAAEFPSRA